MDDINVSGEGESDDIGSEAVDHGAGLLAGATVGLLDIELFPVFLLPLRGERLVDIDVEFTGGIVGNIEEFHRSVTGFRAAGLAGGQDRHGEEEGGDEDVGFHGLIVLE